MSAKMAQLNKREKKFLIALGIRLRSLRTARGWTLEETEEHGWKAWAHLQRIETGKKNINIITLLKLAKLYKISIFEMLKGLV